jgi:hypothetical protein
MKNNEAKQILLHFYEENQKKQQNDPTFSPVIEITPSNVFI